MHVALKPHPDTPCDAVTSLTVDIEYGPAPILVLSYRLTGQLARIDLPAVGLQERGDELWKHTCFELFIRSGDEPGYREFNFSPSRRWAAYDFDGYRSGMRPTADVRVEVPSSKQSYQACSLQVGVDLRAAVPTPRPDWRLGLSAIVETIAGGRCFFALNHPPGEPDFHHPDAFSLDLPA